MNEIVIGADLGGTNLRAAVVNKQGRLLHRIEKATPDSKRRSDILAAIIGAVSECVESCSEPSEVSGVGIAAAAVLDAGRGTISSSPNLPDLAGLDLASVLGDSLNLNVVAENDATAAAIGEHWLGASRGIENSICITLGTGVGGGIILDGKPLRGVDGTAGEIGHICVEPLGIKCGCGSNGCLEQYASATAISRTVRELAAEFPDSIIDPAGEVSPAAVFDAGIHGDALGKEVFRRFGSYLGIALAGLINVLNPEVIVIGGGAAQGWDLFIEELRGEIFKRAFRRPAERANIVRARLGNDAGLLGAAKLALESVPVR